MGGCEMVDKKVSVKEKFYRCSVCGVIVRKVYKLGLCSDCATCGGALQ